MGCGASGAKNAVPVVLTPPSASITKSASILPKTQAPAAIIAPTPLQEQKLEMARMPIQTPIKPQAVITIDESPQSAEERVNKKKSLGKESEDEFDVKSTVGDLQSRDSLADALSNEDKSVPNLATFCNSPEECFYCNSAVVTHVCEVCEDFYVCEDCICNVKCDHNPMHPISVIHEMQLDPSRSLGSSVGTFDGCASSFFYDPCEACNRVIIDTELVFHCDQCVIFICENCFTKNGPLVHPHELKTFQRSVRTSATDSTLVNKTRTTEGNKVINDYVVVKLLGRGSYAKVYLVQHHREHKLYALKILRRNRMSKAKKTLSTKSTSDDDDLLRETAVMKFVSHPNIVRLKEVIDDVEAHKVYVIMEYCEKGPVHVYGNSPLVIEKVRKYGREIMDALLHLHGEYLFHRDIKPANCLVDSTDVVKIADFGTCGSRMKNSNIDGTPAYACPEQFRGLRVSGDVVDSWSFAMSLYQMAHGCLPFTTETIGTLRNSLVGDTPLPVSSEIDPGLQDVLRQMLDKDLTKRMMLRAAAEHPFFHVAKVERPPILPLNEDSLSDESLTDIYARAQKTVLRGKRVSEHFHGMRSMRKMQRKAVKCVNSVECGVWQTEGFDGQIVPLDGASELSCPAVNEEEVNQVVSVILEAQKNGELEFENLQMSQPPLFLVDAAPRTTALRFVNNKLSSVSTLNFARFSELRMLKIVNNKLKTLPIEVFLAPRLQHLDLSHNQIEEIPSAVSSAMLLETLSLNYNLIKHVGCDKSGRSVLSNRCLRKVMLSGNPLSHIPDALETCPRLELTMDDSPVLMEEWAAAVRNRYTTVVLWNEIYPRLIHPKIPLYVAVRNIRLYNTVILETINAENIVLPPADKCLPIGKSLVEGVAGENGESGDADPLNTPEETNGVCKQLQSLYSVMPFLSKPKLLKSFFVWGKVPDDPSGGFLCFKDYLQERAKLGQRTVVFVEERKLKGTVREMVIAALCEAVRECSEDTPSFGECYQMVVDSLRGFC